MRLNEQEKEFLLKVSVQNKLIIWDERDGEENLSLLKRLEEKGILYEGFSSTSANFKNFVLTSDGYKRYQKILAKAKQ
jgi:hypothetical protein